MVIFFLEDFSLFLVKIDHLLLTSDPETNANEPWITLLFTIKNNSCPTGIVHEDLLEFEHGFHGALSLFVQLWRGRKLTLTSTLISFLFASFLLLSRHRTPCLMVAELLRFTTPRTRTRRSLRAVGKAHPTAHAR